MKADNGSPFKSTAVNVPPIKAGHKVIAVKCGNSLSSSHCQNKQFFNKFDILNICIPTQKVEKEESSIVNWV